MSAPNKDLYVGVVIDGPQIDGTTQDLHDLLVASSGDAVLDVDGMRFAVKIIRVSQAGL